MKKKILSLLCVLMLFMSICIPSIANASADLMVDDADLLSDYEEAELQAKLESLSSKYKCDIAIITVESTNGQSIESFSKHYFDNNGYGQGTDKDGIMFVISMENREWNFQVCGLGTKAMNSDHVDEVMDEVLSDLSAGDYYNVFIDIANMSADYIVEATTITLKNIIISLAIGIVIALIIVLILKSQLKSVHMADGAAEYIRQGSFKVTRKNDMFLYKTVTKTPVPKSNDSSSSGGGSSSSGSGNF